MQTFIYDCTPHFVRYDYHFTGKERDSESGLDYFGARYYSSNMGRWMSPDCSKTPEGVPYANLSDPQSLNLYGYVHNNPLSKNDPDGHDWCDACTKFINAVRNTIQVKTSVGSGVEVSGSVAGVKVTAGAATKTETTRTPLGTNPTETKSSIESGLKAKVGTATFELTNKTPISWLFVTGRTSLCFG
jgi:RHS repeat-associated protein